jgi:DNA-binding IclR family transcriptional regulator
MTAKASSSIQVIARLSRLLDAIAAHDEPVSLKTLASATGLHPSTAFRILASLIEHDLVERSANSRYRLGVKLLHLGHCVRGRPDLRGEVRPLAERLRNPTGETTAPSGREDNELASNARERH